MKWLSCVLSTLAVVASLALVAEPQAADFRQPSEARSCAALAAHEESTPRRPAAPAVLRVRGIRVPPAPPPADLSDPWAEARQGEPATITRGEGPEPAAPQARAGKEHLPPGWPPRDFPLRRLFVAEDGGVRIATASVDDQADRPGPALLVYDLGGLAPRGVYPLQALQGHFAADDDAADTPEDAWLPVIPIDGPPIWWEQLARAIVARIGATRWDAKTHLLAWDADAGLLLVRQDERAVRQVETVLDECAARALRVLPVRAEFHRRGADPVVLTVDAPWRRAARACRGLATTYVMDFDIEISMGSFFVGPILQRLETGVGLHALWRRGAGGRQELLLALGSSAGPCEIVSERVTGLADAPPVTIEIAEPNARVWEGRLPAAAGVYVRRIDGDTTCRITVGEAYVPDAVPARAWGRFKALKQDAPLFPEAVFDVRLTGARSGLIGAEVLPVLGSLGEGSTQLRPSAARMVSPAAVRNGLALDGDPALTGGVLLEAYTVGPWQCPLALDVVLEAGRLTKMRRALPIVYLDRDGKHATEPVQLPEAHLDVTTQRVFLSEEGVGALEFSADVGRGVERCVLEIRPHEPAR